MKMLKQIEEHIAAYKAQGDQLQLALTQLEQEYASKKDLYQSTLQQLVGALGALEALKQGLQDVPPAEPVEPAETDEQRAERVQHAIAP
jgi:chromosome segregation ATPase